jgi:hypothetical protein
VCPFNKYFSLICSVYFEVDEFYCPPSELDKREHGGIAVARGRRVVKLIPSEHKAILNDNTVIKYDKCLIATGLFVCFSK